MGNCLVAAGKLEGREKCENFSTVGRLHQLLLKWALAFWGRNYFFEF
jgi:hypothetical protein